MPCGVYADQETAAHAAIDRPSAQLGDLLKVVSHPPRPDGDEEVVLFLRATRGVVAAPPPPRMLMPNCTWLRTWDVADDASWMPMYLGTVEPRRRALAFAAALLECVAPEERQSVADLVQTLRSGTNLSGFAVEPDVQNPWNSFKRFDDDGPRLPIATKILCAHIRAMLVDTSDGRTGARALYLTWALREFGPRDATTGSLPRDRRTAEVLLHYIPTAVMLLSKVDPEARLPLPPPSPEYP